jgi:HEAT repeat protein
VPAAASPQRLTTVAAQGDSGTGELLPLEPGVEEAVLAAARRPARGPDSAAIERFRAQLSRVKRGPSDYVRERSVWALSIARGGRVVEPAIEHLRHPDWRVRAYATWVLGVADDPRAVEPLIESLRDPHWRPRMHAASSLGLLRAGPEAVDPLVAALADSVYQVRVSAVTALGEIGDVRALSAVQARTKDSYPWVRMAAGEAEARLRRLLPR